MVGQNTQGRMMNERCRFSTSSAAHAGALSVLQVGSEAHNTMLCNAQQQMPWSDRCTRLCLDRCLKSNTNAVLAVLAQLLLVPGAQLVLVPYRAGCLSVYPRCKKLHTCTAPLSPSCAGLLFQAPTTAVSAAQSNAAHQTRVGWRAGHKSFHGRCSNTAIKTGSTQAVQPAAANVATARHCLAALANEIWIAGTADGGALWDHQGVANRCMFCCKRLCYLAGASMLSMRCWHVAVQGHLMYGPSTAACVDRGGLVHKCHTFEMCALPINPAPEHHQCSMHDAWLLLLRQHPRYKRCLLLCTASARQCDAGKAPA